MLTILTQTIPGAIGVSGPPPYTVTFADGQAREVTAGELLAATKAQRIAAIKSKRDAVKGEGVTVGANRFHSDADSRIQQMGLVMMGASLPAVQWKTMGGAFVEMTPTLAGQIFSATAARDIAVFGHAEALIAQVNAAASPEAVAAIDIEAGWPA